MNGLPSLADLMRSAIDKDEPDTPHDVLAHTLLEMYARRIAPNPFKPGDLVTPRKGHWTNGAGAPHVVLDIFEEVRPDKLDIQQAASCHWPDMRIACEIGGILQLHLGESLGYEPWLGQVAIVN